MSKSTRGQGEGSVFQLEDGRWRAQHDTGLKLRSGNRKYLTRTRKTKTEALKALRALQREADMGIKHDGSWTFKKWLDYYIDEVKADRTPTTRRGYHQHADRWLIPVLGTKKLADISPEDLEAIYKPLRKAGMAPTLRQVHAVAHGALNVARKRRHIPFNPAQMVEVGLGQAAQIAAAKPVKKKTTFSAPEARVIIAHAEKTSLEMHVRALLALMLALRPAEALGLRWCDIDLHAGTMTVRHALVRGEAPDGKRQGEFVLGETKTKRPRDLPIPAPLSAALTLWKAATPKDKSEDFILVMFDPRPGRFQRRVSDPDQTDGSWWKRMVVSAGVARAPRYAARRTAATLLMEAGVPLTTVRDILGHTDVATTSIYVRPDVEMKSRGTDALAAVYGNAMPTSP